MTFDEYSAVFGFSGRGDNILHYCGGSVYGTIGSRNHFGWFFGILGFVTKVKVSYGSATGMGICEIVCVADDV